MNGAVFANHLHRESVEQRKGGSLADRALRTNEHKDGANKYYTVGDLFVLYQSQCLACHGQEKKRLKNWIKKGLGYCARVFGFCSKGSREPRRGMRWADLESPGDTDVEKRSGIWAGPEVGPGRGLMECPVGGA